MSKNELALNLLKPNSINFWNTIPDKQRQIAESQKPFRFFLKKSGPHFGHFNGFFGEKMPLKPHTHVLL